MDHLNASDTAGQDKAVLQKHSTNHEGGWRSFQNQQLKKCWGVCKELGLRRDLQKLPCCSEAEMKCIKETTTKLYAYSNRLIQGIIHWTSRPLAFVLVDAQGVVLKTYCKNDFVKRLEQKGIREGAHLSETESGATAFSLGIRTLSPCRTSGTEHYLDMFTDLTMYFAPFVLENNSVERFGVLELLGGIGVITSYVEQYEDYLTTVITMSKEVCLHLDMVNTFYNFYLTETLGYICVDIDGETRQPYCLYHNSNIFNILDIPFADLCFKRLDSVFDPLPSNQEFWDIVKKGKRLHNASIPLSIRGVTKQYIVSTDLYQQREVGYEGIRFFISNTEKISSFVSKQIGNNAILTFDNVIGSSHEIKQVIRYAKRYAEFDNNVLIIGESGVGKDIFAQAIHNGSDRRSRPFIALNCATFPRDLMVSELFGYEPGAFTGSRKNGNTGKLELANTGTLFLDEIGTLPLDLQAILLRAMETKRFMKLGASKETVVDVRIIAATNENILDIVAQKRFRPDLYFRLSTFVLNIPPLRKRKEDIVLLAHHFINVVSSRIHIAPPRITEGAISYLCKLPWPGNVRELQNMIEGIVQIYLPSSITVEHIANYMSVVGRMDPIPEEGTPSDDTAGGHPRAPEGERLTEAQLREALKNSGGNRSKAAGELGVSRKTLYKWIKRYQL